MYHDLCITTYRQKFTELEQEKQFHLATRLALWNHDSWASNQIKKQKEAFLGGTNRSDWRAKMDDIQSRSPQYERINHSSNRKVYFEAYPGLFGLELGMFQALHAYHHFNVDLTGFLPLQETIESLINRLLSDPKALGTLSTYAIDIFYLYYRFLQHDNKPLLPTSLLNEACEESPSVQLAVYLMTHCIIGETLFYNREIPRELMSYYHELVTMLNDLSEKNWPDLTLDNRLEIALCNQITGTISPLISRAVADADEHFSKELGCVIDPKKPNKSGLNGSEHRNALYLMVTAEKSSS